MTAKEPREIIVANEEHKAAHSSINKEPQQANEAVIEQEAIIPSTTLPTPNIAKLLTKLTLLNVSNLSGTKKQLEKRLKHHTQLMLQNNQDKLDKEDLVKRAARKQPFLYYLICDVEATCEDNSGFGYASEIIEFPIVLVNGTTMETIGVFREIVRPTLKPNLSGFCKKLTGITQDQVDQADTFKIVWSRFQEWLKNAIAPHVTSECCFVTDGPWDLRDFMEKELMYNQIERPVFMKKVVDLRRAFKKHYEKDSGSLLDMLSHLELKFEGQQHSGIDDSRNIARIFVKIADEGFRFESNLDLKKNKAKKGDWMAMRKLE